MWSQFHHVWCQGHILCLLPWGWSRLGLEVGLEGALLNVQKWCYSMRPSSAEITTSSYSSTLVSFLSSAFMAVHSAKVAIFLLTQSDDRCPNPWHFKHQILPRGWGLRAGGGLICGWVEGIRGDLIELPLLKVCPKGRNGKGSSWGGLGYSCLKSFLLLCCSTLYARTHTASKVVNC